ncbi:hypothetical protein RJ639_032557 [Escallonia herrerae]|uniref:Uncharacterized protein n=1 Tax=Escallonia herrerae TaxID=1293975 RepID=A0AA89BBF5_9ASTE|nr:hypothetical protein RJ639_032557 [Escallonia herrerae]
MVACLLPPLSWAIVEVLENLAYLANASNLVTYLSKFMHYSPSSSANIVTNFMGTAFLLALLGGFLSDAFFTTYHIYLINATIEFLVFCLSCGALIAVTFVVWVEDNKGWQWGFGISTMTILITIPIFLLGSATYRTKVPTGSPITTLFKVLVAAICNTGFSRTPENAVTSMTTTPSYTMEASEEEEGQKKQRAPNHSATENLKFLNRAVINKPVHPALGCTTQEVEEVKIVLKILPIFMTTMNTKIGSLSVPPASLPVFPVLFIMILALVYNDIILPFARKLTKTEMGVTYLQRIGTGLFLSIVAMAVAALVEMKRKKVVALSGLQNSTKPLPITFLWVALQYLFLGSADLFSLAGMMEFFFTEAPLSMRSLATALSWASLAMGYYLSSVLVSVVNCVTGTYRHTPWLYGANVNHYHLERFYWLMCALSS